MLLEERAQLRDVAVARGGEDLAVERERVDVRLERAPARKAELLGQRKLRVSELRVGIRFLEFFETTLGLLAEPIEIGVFGKRHATPSFL